MTPPVTCEECRTGVVIDPGADRCRKCRAARPDAPPPPAPPVLSDVARRLEDVFQVIRRRHPEIPHFLVVIATGAEGKKGVTHWGHFAPRRWIRRTTESLPDGSTLPRMAEVKIAAEGLSRPTIEVLGTMLHEAAHALAEARGIVDTSNEGRYHNTHFAYLAREVGLTPPAKPVRRHGYAFTAPNAALETRYGSALRELEAALTLYRQAPSAAGKAAGESRPAKRVAVVCQCLRKLTVAPGVLAQGAIVCGVCRSDFVPEGPDVRDDCNACATQGDECSKHGMSNSEGVDE